jgi:microcystin-dependent protein
MPFWSWSKTAASNATADTTINWAEGQSPSSVNDSARAMMARTAEWRDDVSGTLTTSGTATAYALASNQGFDSLAHLAGALVAFVPHVTCGATVTLNVDSLGSRPLRTSPGVELPSGLLIQGTPYVATYNNGDGAFYLRGFYALPYAIPLGAIIPYVGATAPNSSFALPYGQAISRTGYAALFALMGTTFGGGDGSTTFNLPDLRGRGIFGLDSMGGTASSRIGSVVTDNGTVSGTTLGSTGGSATHALTQAEMPSHSHAASVIDTGHSHGIPMNGANNAGSNAIPQNADLDVGNGINSRSATTGISVSNSNTGGGAAHSILPPLIILPFILRVI